MLAHLLGLPTLKTSYQLQESLFCDSDKHLGYPFGVAISPSSGEIFVSDHYSSMIVVFNKKGEFLRSFSGEDDDKLSGPCGCIFNIDGNFVVVDNGTLSPQFLYPGVCVFRFLDHAGKQEA